MCVVSQDAIPARRDGVVDSPGQDNSNGVYEGQQPAEKRRADKGPHQERIKPKLAFVTPEDEEAQGVRRENKYGKEVRVYYGNPDDTVGDHKYATRLVKPAVEQQMKRAGQHDQHRIGTQFIHQAASETV